MTATIKIFRENAKIELAIRLLLHYKKEKYFLVYRLTFLRFTETEYNLF